MSQQQELPEYTRPPVIEVVCGIQFEPIHNLLAPHLGLLWEKFRPEYPVCREVAPLAPVIEKFGQEAPVAFQFSDVPPLPRVWFIREEGNGIVQVQRDRFLHNWKRVKDADEYPRYTSVMAMFKDRLATFEAFLSENQFSKIKPRQYELTYVNHIPRAGRGSAAEGIGSVLPDFCWRALSDRFLPLPDSLNWRTSFPLADHRGRLHMTVRSGKRKQDDQEMILLDLTARGIGESKSRNAMWEWFDLAHEWIVRGFTDVTGREMHEKNWQRIR